MLALALSMTLHLIFHPKQVIFQRADILDKNDWVLPKKRLEGFRRAGTVIAEERHLIISAWTTVDSVSRGVASLAGIVRRKSFDVLRGIATNGQEGAAAALDDHNHRLGCGLRLAQAEAAVEEFLESWSKGEPPDVFAGTHPKITADDPDRKAGYRMAARPRVST